MKNLALNKMLKTSAISVMLGVSLYAAPTSFSTFDKDGDGIINEDEFYQTQAQNMEQRANENRLMKNAANAPSFSDVDANGDGQITEQEHQTFQYNRMKTNRINNSYNKGYGGGYGRGNGNGGGGGGGGGR